MKATEEEQAVIIEYLATNFLGEAPRPVNVNNAEQIDFESVLGLLRREAAAVIAYREKNGPFKTVDQLAMVDGITQKLIERNRADIKLGADKAPAPAVPAAAPAPKAAKPAS
jgi:competence protein ComEA